MLLSSLSSIWKLLLCVLLSAFWIAAQRKKIPEKVQFNIPRLNTTLSIERRVVQLGMVVLTILFIFISLIPDLIYAILVR